MFLIESNKIGQKNRIFEETKTKKNGPNYENPLKISTPNEHCRDIAQWKSFRMQRKITLIPIRVYPNRLTLELFLFAKLSNLANLEY